jgi:hypothetical protein
MTFTARCKYILIAVTMLSIAACATFPKPGPAPAKPETIAQPQPVAETPSPVVTTPPKPVTKPAPAPTPAVIKPKVSTDITRKVQPAPKPEPKIAPIAVKPMTLSSLPMRFGKEWTLDRRPNPLIKTTECLLISDPITIPDGYDKTRVKLLLTTNKLYVQTDSNIDLSYPHSGVQIDDSPVWAFDKVIKDTSTELGTHFKEALSRLDHGKTITVHLGFWPTWPMTKTREASFSLEGMKAAVTALTECEKM